MPHNLQPRDGALHVVRWIREDGKTVKHRYFRRAQDAHDFVDKLRTVKPADDVALYTTDTTWTEVTR